MCSVSPHEKAWTDGLTAATWMPTCPMLSTCNSMPRCQMLILKCSLRVIIMYLWALTMLSLAW